MSGWSPSSTSRRQRPGRTPTPCGTSAEILLRNALQATPPGGRIQVRSSRKDGELIWSFSDNGKGIGAGEAAHLFDPFYCGRQAGRGLGLGLPRAAKIVDAGRRPAPLDIESGA